MELREWRRGVARVGGGRWKWLSAEMLAGGDLPKAASMLCSVLWGVGSGHRAVAIVSLLLKGGARRPLHRLPAAFRALPALIVVDVRVKLQSWVTGCAVALD